MKMPAAPNANGSVMKATTAASRIKTPAPIKTPPKIPPAETSPSASRAACGIIASGLEPTTTVPGSFSRGLLHAAQT
jgi:hypothetical protein